MAGTADRIARAHAEKRDLAAFEAARTPAPGALTPRRRIEQLIDPGSLFEIGALTRSQLPAIEDATPGDGAVAGFADVGGRLVGVIADDPVIMARSDGGVGMNKRLRIVQQSLAGGVAIAYLADAALPAQFPAAAEGLLRRGQSDRASVVPELRLEERQAPLIAVVLGGLEGADTGLLAAADLTIAGGAASAATRAIADIAVADDAPRSRPRAAASPSCPTTARMICAATPPRRAVASPTTSTPPPSPSTTSSPASSTRAATSPSTPPPTASSRPGSASSRGP